MNAELLLILKGLTPWLIRYRMIRGMPKSIRGFWVFQVYAETLLELSQRGSTGEEVG